MARKQDIRSKGKIGIVNDGITVLEIVKTLKRSQNNNENNDKKKKKNRF